LEEIVPELPEVETVKNTLKNLILNKEIRDVDIFYDRIIRNVSNDEFKSKLVGNKFEDITRYGKYLIFHIGELRLISHLRMEGKYFIKDVDEPKNKHDHIIIYFSNGETLRYNDVRKFGTMDIVSKNDLYTNSPLIKLGLEPFDESLNTEYLKKKFANKKVSVKTALLDQSILTGLGNIYVDEVLFMCRLNPLKKVDKLKKKDLENIIKYSIIVLNKAIKLGGTTIRSYTSSLGVTGLFQNELLVHTKEGEPCPSCSRPILKQKVNGRGTYYCEVCQK